MEPDLNQWFELLDLPLVLALSALCLWLLWFAYGPKGRMFNGNRQAKLDQLLRDVEEIKRRLPPPS